MDDSIETGVSGSTTPRSPSRREESSDDDRVSESGLSRDSWPSLQDTLASTEYSDEIYVRRENQRFGWRKCTGRISTRSVPNEEAWLQIDGSDGYKRRAWRLNELMIEVQAKRTGLRVTQQSTTGGRPIYRILLLPLAQMATSDPESLRATAFDIGFFGVERFALEKRDLWLRHLLLAGATPGFAVDLTAKVLAPLLDETSHRNSSISIVSATHENNQSAPTSTSAETQETLPRHHSLQRGLTGEEESKQQQTCVQQETRLSCASIEEKRLAAALAALTRGFRSSHSSETPIDQLLSTNKKSLKQYIYMATEAALGICAENTELRRSATECLAVAAVTAPLLVASLSPFICLINDFTAKALLELLSTSVRARRAILEADTLLARAALYALTQRLTEEHIPEVLSVLLQQDAHSNPENTTIFPCLLYTAVPSLLISSPEENSVAKLAVALAQRSPKRWAAAVAQPSAVAAIIASLRKAREDIAASSQRRLHLISALAAACCSDITLKLPEDNAAAASEAGNATELDQKKDDIFDSLLAAVTRENRLIVSEEDSESALEEENAFVIDNKKNDDEEHFCKIFNTGGQAGLGLELTAGPWRSGVVAPAVHRTNNATHRRGVAFKDELIDINGRLVEYELKRSSAHAEVRAAMIAACDTVRDAPWPKRLTFVRRKPPDSNPPWQKWLSARPIHTEHQSKSTHRESVYDRARRSLAAVNDNLIDALCAAGDETWTRLYACRLLVVLANEIRLPLQALAFAADELSRASHLFSHNQDGDDDEEAGTTIVHEDMAMLPLAAYAALLEARSTSDDALHKPICLDHTAMTTDEITGRLALLVSRLDEIPLKDSKVHKRSEEDEMSSSDDAKEEEWWHDPKARYEEHCCTIESPPLACTMALRGHDPSNLACRVESVVDEGRADLAGVCVNDVLVTANTLPAPRKATTDTALVDFFKSLEYPISLHFVRRVNIEQGEDEEKAVATVVDSMPFEPLDDDDTSAIVDHDGALGACLSSLLYSSRAGVAALAAHALELAARSRDASTAAHGRVMAVKQASAIAMTPALVQRISSWTPPANESPEGLTRDEAAQLVPLAETEFSDAVPLADFAAPRVLQAVAAPRQDDVPCSDGDDLVVPGSILARLLDAATGDGDDDDDQRDILRATALDTLTALCGAHDKSEDEHIRQLRKQVASACVAEPEAVRGILKLVSGARGAGVAAAAVRFLLSASTTIRSAASTFVYAGAFHSLAWLLRVDEIPSKATYRRKSFSTIKCSFPRKKADATGCWWWLPPKKIQELPTSINACRGLALDSLVVLLDACREVSLGFSVVDELPDEDADSSLNRHSATVVRGATSCLSNCGNILKAPDHKHERQRAVRAIGVAALAIRDALSEPVLTAVAAKSVEQYETAVSSIVVVLVATDARLYSAAASDSVIQALLRSIETDVESTRLLACQGLEKLCHGSQIARDALASHSDALQTALTSTRSQDFGDFEPLLRACASSKSTAAILARIAAPDVARALARNDAAALMIADTVTEPELWAAVSERNDALTTLCFVLAKCASVHTLNAAADCLAASLSVSSQSSIHSEIPRAALERLLSSAPSSAACCRALSSLAQMDGLVPAQAAVRRAVCRALASQEPGCREAATEMCANLAPDEGASLAALAVRLMKEDDAITMAASRVAAIIDDTAGRAAPLALVLTLLDTSHQSSPELSSEECESLSVLLEIPPCRACALGALSFTRGDIMPSVRAAVLFALGAPEGDDVLSALSLRAAARIVATMSEIDADLVEALVTALENFVSPNSAAALYHAVFELSAHFTELSSDLVSRCVECLAQHIIDADTEMLAAASTSALASLALAVRPEPEPLIRAALSPAADSFGVTPLLLFVLRRLGSTVDQIPDSSSSSSRAFHTLLGASRLLVDDIVDEEDEANTISHEANDMNRLSAVEQEDQDLDDLANDEKQASEDVDEEAEATAAADEAFAAEEDAESEISSESSEAMVEAVVELEEPEEEENVEEAQVVVEEDASSDVLDSDLQAALELSVAEQRESSLDEEAQLRAALELSVRESEIEQERRDREAATAASPSVEEEQKSEDTKSDEEADSSDESSTDRFDGQPSPVYEEPPVEPPPQTFTEESTTPSTVQPQAQSFEEEPSVDQEETDTETETELPPPPAYEEIFQGRPASLSPRPQTPPSSMQVPLEAPAPPPRPTPTRTTNQIRLF